MIVGIGVDIVMIERIEKIFNEYGQRFLKKILGLDELNHIQKIYNRKLKIQKIATRFAAKEAIMKALPVQKKIGYSQFQIKNLDDGRPHVKIEKNLKEKLSKFNINQFYISLSHEEKYAIAFATISS